MNQDTQSGKTVTTLNLGYALVLMNKKVMLVDSDPNTQLSKICCKESAKIGLHQVLQQQQTIDQTVVSLADGLDMLPAGEGLESFEQTGVDRQRGQQLRQVIEQLGQSHDFILIDSPAKAGLLSVNAMLAADEIVITTKPTTKSVQGMIRIVQLFKRLKHLSGGAKLWLVLTQLRPTDPISIKIKNKVLHYFPKRVLNTHIRQDNALAESQLNNKAIFDYQQDGFGAADYYALAQNILEGRVS